MSDKNIDKVFEKLDVIEEKIKLQKENGCKLLECKVIDKNIKLQCKNINYRKELETYKKIAEKLASTTYDYANLEMLNICPAEYEGKVDLRKCKQNHIERNCIQCIIDWARNEEN